MNLYFTSGSPIACPKSLKTTIKLSTQNTQISEQPFKTHTQRDADPV